MFTRIRLAASPTPMSGFDLVILDYRMPKKDGIGVAKEAEDILDVSRIEGKRLKLNKESFSVNETVIKIVEDSRTSLRNDAVTMTFTSNVNGQRDGVYGEKYRIIQVITNHVANAVKFTQEGQD